MRLRSREKYAEELRQMVEERTGKAFEKFLTPQLNAAASMMRMIDRIDKQIEKEDLWTLEAGSQGQTKTVVHPLLPEYQRCQRVFNTLLTSLGLTFNATPSKITESTKETDVNKMDEIDKMYNDF